MSHKGVPHVSAIKDPPAMQETQEMWVGSLSQDYSLEEGMQHSLVFLLGKSDGQISLVG